MKKLEGLKRKVVWLKPETVDIIENSLFYELRNDIRNSTYQQVIERGMRGLQSKVKKD